MNNKGFICPLCGSALIKKDNAMHCIKGHSFDIAKEGYTYLLPPQKKRTKDPGDSKEMVNSRAEFLEAGFYDIFADALAEICLNAAKKSKKTLHILDMGCGEGYYSRAISKKLSDLGINFELIGIDIAKTAVRRAAKLAPNNCTYSVASCFSCPIKSEWADIVINIFAPLAHEETSRILKKGGLFIYAVPGPMHLFGLKKVLYETPYENPIQKTDYDGFDFLGAIETEGNIHVTGSYVQDLFCMTPYYWKTPREGSERLALCQKLDTPIQFRFLQYIKSVESTESTVSSRF